MTTKPTYRPDIDGLRCMSVLAVLAFHFGSRNISGGFVGVDVFFVISGFVITAQLYRELEAGSFSILSFYDRRVRRILPATLVMILATVIAGAFLLPPQDYSRLGHSALAAAVGVSNIYFLSETDYFEPAHRSIALLHTWSLAVEEQFYLVWPLLLAFITWASKGSKSAVMIALITITIASFVASIMIVRVDQPQAFYMPYTRAWELALGALLVFVPRITGPIAAEVASAAGIALISFAIVRLNGHSLFPGANALFPCVGAALVIAPKIRETVIARILSYPPIVFIGAISFSLYLWHWPLYVFYAFYDPRVHLASSSVCALVIASFAFAVLSYFLIEQPIRNLRPRRALTLFSGAIASACICALGSTVVFAEGFPRRFSPESLKYFAYARPAATWDGPGCFLSSRRDDAAFFDNARCVQISPSKPNVLIVGDSHANQFVQAVRTRFPDVNFSQVTSSGCLPILPLRGRHRCTTLMQRMIDQFVVEHTFDDIVLSGRWQKGAVPGIKAIVTLLAQRARHITVLGPNAEYASPLPFLLGKAIDRSDIGLVNRASTEKATERVSQAMGQALAGTPAQFLSVVDVQCRDRICKSVTDGGVPMLFDDNHLTFEGATEIVRSLENKGLFSWRARQLQQSNLNPVP